MKLERHVKCKENHLHVLKLTNTYVEYILEYFEIQVTKQKNTMEINLINFKVICIKLANQFFITLKDVLVLSKTLVPQNQISKISASMKVDTSYIAKNFFALILFFWKNFAYKLELKSKSDTCKLKVNCNSQPNR